MALKFAHLVVLLFACATLVPSTHAVAPPNNYTLPIGVPNLCFAGQFNLALSVKYPQADGKMNTVTIPLDNTTYGSYTGTCGLKDVPNSAHILTISMLNSLTNLVFTFTINEHNCTSLTYVTAYISIDDLSKRFPNYDKSVEGVHKFIANVSMFETDEGNSYRCNTKTSITGFAINKNVTLSSIDVENLRIQPFVDNSKPFMNYGIEKVCAADIIKNSNLIPIIVGICLAVLVVVVLVAYLIGRRRNRNGYQSV